MARVLKKPGSLQLPSSPVSVPLTKESTAEVRQVLGTIRRRLLKEKEHPAVAQFSDPEAKARVRERLAINPNLLPSAFSHRPGREGCELTAVEAERVGCGKSIKVTGFSFSESSGSECLDCFNKRGRPSNEKGKGFTIALFDSDSRTRLCTFCGKVFQGER